MPSKKFKNMTTIEKITDLIGDLWRVTSVFASLILRIGDNQIEILRELGMNEKADEVAGAFVMAGEIFKVEIIDRNIDLLDEEDGK